MRARRPLLAAAMLTMFAALVGGVARLGWVEALETVAVYHGPLMVGGFLGALITLERAVALRRWWTALAPVLCAFGSFLLIVGAPTAVAAVAYLLASIGLLAMHAATYRQHRSVHLVVSAVGAACWAVSSALWLGGFLFWRLVPWWMGFLGLTIGGERRELSRFLIADRRQLELVLGAVALAVGGYAVSTVAFDIGTRIEGVAYVVIAAWLLRNDMARRAARKPGVSRFSAVALLLGYGWLGVVGILRLVRGGIVGILTQDAILHSFFLGFVLSMVFGHAPTVFPALMRLPMRFSRAFYVHVILLHATLAARVFGDLTLQPRLWRWGGLLNALVLILFVANTAVGALRASPFFARFATRLAASRSSPPPTTADEG